MSDYLYDPNDFNFVPKFYQMDPETEDLLPGSIFLSEGMVVLIADSSRRQRPEEGAEDWKFDKLLENNRWCTVTHLEVGAAEISFVAVYENGTKRLRNFGTKEAWLVKRDSVSAALQVTNERYLKVYASVKALIEVVPTNFSESELDFMTQETTKQILRLFK